MGTFEVRIRVDSLVAGIVPGINVHVDFVLFEKKGVLAVPFHFVHRKKTKRRHGTPGYGKRRGELLTEPVRLKLGLTDYKQYEVLSGIEEGETIAMPEGRSERKKTS